MRAPRWQLFLLGAALVGVGAASCSGDDDTSSTSSSSRASASASVSTSGGGGNGGSGGGSGMAPAAPSITSVAPLGQGLHVIWMDNSDNEDNFVLERHDGSGTFMEVFTLPFDSTQYHDEGSLVSGTTYTYRVGAINASGTSYSMEASGMAP